MIDTVSMIVLVSCLFLAGAVFALTHGLARAKRAADREFGDWPDQIEDRARKTRQPDDPGTGREAV